MAANKQIENILNLKNNEEYTLVTEDLSRDFIINLKECFHHEYCEDCKGIKGFKTIIENSSKLYKWLFDFIKMNLGIDSTVIESDEYGYIILSSHCVTCGKEHLKLYSFYNNTIKKAFQAPNQVKNNNLLYKKYKVITKPFNYFAELSTARYLYHDHDASIGAFVYIRRCLETFVNSKLTNEQIAYHFEDKIKLLDNVDNEITELLKPCYSFLSKGIHQLDEKECKEKFEIVFGIIILLLDDELTKIEKKNKMKEFKNKINN